ncbi:MAG: RNHCP domain-containing protein [Streptosporangiaceae bacterium]
MSRSAENQEFTCANCGITVRPVTNGGYRNHCPRCLWSMHVDVAPGDRAADCGGPMRPEHLEHRPGKGLVIVHRCVRCGHRRANRIARDTVQADDIDAIAELLSAPGPAGPRVSRDGRPWNRRSRS